MLRHGVTVHTADDASYLRPALNFLEFGEWKDNSAGVRAYVQRSPGYGLLYAAATSIFGEVNALWVMIFAQLLLWCLALSLIPDLGTGLGLKEKLAWFLGFFVALMPMFSGFLSYTLTEAITPSLVIIFYVLFMKGVKGSRRSLFAAALVLGFTLLVRPALIVLVLSYLPLVFRLKTRLIPLLVLSLMPLFIWQLRVERITDRFDLHPIYHQDSNDLYRPLHGEIWNFHKMTGQSGGHFHTSMNHLWRAAGGAESEDFAVAATLRLLHKSAKSSIGEERLKAMYTDYIRILRQQSPYNQAQLPINTALKGENKLIEDFREIKRTYVQENFVQAWINGPLEVSGNLVLHSNLSLYIFQGPWRGAIPMEILRWLSLLVHLLSFTLFLVVPFLVRKNSIALSMWLPAFLYLAYLIFVQRGIEERYTLPFLVPAFLLSVLVLNSIRSQILILRSRRAA